MTTDAPSAVDELGASGDPKSLQDYRLVVLMLSVVMAIAYVDRQVLVILIEPIKRDLQLSDTQIGILTGIAFSMVYATLGIPVARLADRTSRKNVIVVAIVFWSAMTALCGLAHSVWQLMAARIGVGAGESGCTPPAHSIIAAVTPPDRLGWAMGVYSVGVPVGVLLGMLGGGWLGDVVGWRYAFLIVAAPGLLVAAWVGFGLREPLRRHQASSTEQIPPIGQALRQTLGKPALALTLLGSGLTATGVGVLLVWTPSLLGRTTEMSGAAIGAWLGLVIGVGGAIGMSAGGLVGDWLSRRNPLWRLWMPAVCAGVAAASSLLMLQQPGSALLLALLCPAILFGMAPTGVVNGVVQILTPTLLRSFAASLLVFANTALGLGLGPLIVGLISDALDAADSLRSALLVAPVFFLAGSVCLWLAARNIRPDQASAMVGFKGRT